MSVLALLATTEEIERIHHNALLFFFREPKVSGSDFHFERGAVTTKDSSTKVNTTRVKLLN